MSHLTRRRFVSNGALAGALLTPFSENAEAAPAAQAQTNVQDRAPAVAERPDQFLRRMIGGFGQTQLIYIAAKLKIADHLANGPQTVTQLARVTGSHDDSLYRILRALAGFGVFSEEEGGRFRLTPTAELLRSDIPGSLRASAEVRGEDWYWRAWGALRESVRTGKTGFEVIYGKNTFDWFAENPDAGRLFDEFQSEVTAESSAAVSKVYDFSTARVVVDVGGGDGTLLTDILRQHLTPRGILFDLPHVVTAAEPGIDGRVSPRFQFVGGDFFKSVPVGGDVYVLKYILHDWEDGRAQAILSSCHRAMVPGSKLLVVEDLVCGPNVACDAKMGDINMLARTGGRNRTEREYRDLLSAGRFDTRRVLPVTGSLAAIEAVRA